MMTPRQGIKRARRWLGRHLRRQAVILVYHRVAALETDPWSLAVRPQHFAEHLEVLSRYARVCTLDALAQSVRDGRAPCGAVAITFDDGYRDVFSDATPMLERADLPATVFITTAGVTSRKEFWWDELDRVILQAPTLPPRLVLHVGGQSYTWDVGGSADLALSGGTPNLTWKASDPPRHWRHVVFHDLWHVLQRANAAERETALEALAHWAGISREPRPHYQILQPDEVAALGRGRLIAVGAHTVTHPRLAGLTLPQQRHEIVGSKRQLEELTERPVTSFSYPFGRPSDYTEETVRAVRESGFTCACSNHDGVVVGSTDVHQLPRLYVHDWDGDAFARRLFRYVRRSKAPVGLATGSPTHSGHDAPPDRAP